MTDGTDSGARKAIPRRLRFEILRRDGHTCFYCGASAPDVKLTVDHVIPVVLGGGDEPSNLVTACADCNSGKASSSPDEAVIEGVDATAALFAKAMERAAELRRSTIDEMQAQIVEFYEIWRGYSYSDGGKVPLDPDWEPSIERFISHGLTIDDMREFVHDTMAFDGARNRFRLFCGKCWKEIGYRQELARRLIEDGEV